MDILKRPFSVEPLTGVMLPDGIFDTAIFQQRITCYYTNVGITSLSNVTIYLESIGDLTITPQAKTYTFPEIKPGASIQVSWLADFRNASPGKKNVSFIAKADGLTLKRTIKQIFVSKTTYDPVSKTFTCAVPEGSITVDFKEVIGPSKDQPRCDCDRPPKGPPFGGPWLVTQMSAGVSPNPPYSGTFGDLPFQDPWWKILGWIVFAIAALVAAIAAAVGEGTAGIAASGTFDESTGSVSCCTPDPGGTADLTGADTVAGIASVVGTVGLAVGLADTIDPWRRGQEATPPAPGEQTIREDLEASFKYLEPLVAGKPYAVEVRWLYTRVTTGKTYTYSVSEVVNNIHVLEKLEVTAPEKVILFKDPFVIQARFLRRADQPFVGDELYAYAIVTSPSGIGFRVPLLDDGNEFDNLQNDGTYTGVLDWKKVRTLLRQAEERENLNGYWRVYVYAQDVNDAKPDLPPEEAATHIGGFPVASPVEINFDTTLPCPLTANAVVLVI
jgi:hypothetical protein